MSKKPALRGCCRRSLVAMTMLSLMTNVVLARDCPATPSSDPIRPDTLLEGGKRVARSALFTFPTYDIRAAEQAAGGVRRTQLTLHSTGHAPRLLAAVATRPGRVSIVWHPPFQGPDVERLRLSGIEALYAFLLHQVPLAEFELTASVDAKARPAMSHGAALATLASWRDCAVAELRASGYKGQTTVWEQASIQPQPPVPDAHRRVGAIVRGADGRPAANAPTAFLRGAHLTCQARTGDDGAVSCELFDSHGDGDHDDDETAPMIISFGGVVTRERILLPTTRVVPGVRP